MISYEILLKQILGGIPEIKIALILDKNGNLIAGAYPGEFEDRIESLSIFSAILNLSNQKLIDLIFLGEIETFYLKGSEGYFILSRVDNERLLIVKTTKNVRIGLINMDCRRFVEKIRNIPHHTFETFENLEEKLKKIEREFVENNQIFFNYATTEDKNYQLKNLINTVKGQILETDSRKIFRREHHYSILDSGKNWKINNDEVSILLNEDCQKNSKTQSIEIDIFGEKTESNRPLYIFGECKNRIKKITRNEIKCFIIKSNIIASYLLKFHEIQTQSIPLFHLIIVSLKGFPEKKTIKLLLKKYWRLPQNRILNRSIELIDKTRFIELLKKNNIPSKIYVEQFAI